MSKSKFITRITSTPKLMFMVDALGAMVSMLSLIILAPLERYFGIPGNILYFLAAIAFSLFVYSFCCHRFIKINWKPFLRAIIVLNTSYLLTSMAVVVRHFDIIKPLGFAYLVLELVVISFVISLEYRTYRIQN